MLPSLPSFNKKTYTMEIHRIPLTHVPHFAENDLAYASRNPALRPFYKYEPVLTSFPAVLEDKAKDHTDRALLVEVLEQQYAPLHTNPRVLENIQKLRNPRTFTLTTAHQPVIFTGPLYYVYKILGTIHLARHLSDSFPEYGFVPVFVSGSEDHDFDEINHTYLFGKKLEWQQPGGGAVGRLACDTLQDVLSQLEALLGDSATAKEIFEEIKAAYTCQATFGSATIDLVNRLFGAYGLVALDMNQAALKKKFVPIMREELFQQPSQPLVTETQAALEKAGFSSQAHAREINLFYLSEHGRHRIVRDESGFLIHGTETRFSSAEIDELLETHPERFSPNVVLRPLYQESILPNLAYIGGGGEIAYWLERKTQFAHFGINFPMLIRRNSVLWVEPNLVNRMDKLGLQPMDLLLDSDALIRRFIGAQATESLSLQEERDQAGQLFRRVLEKAVTVDPTLEKAVLAEESKFQKVLEQLEGRLLRAEKQKHDTEVQQLRNLKEKLFPGQSLQERRDNFMNFYPRYGRSFFDQLLEVLNPLSQDFILFIDN